MKCFIGDYGSEGSTIYFSTDKQNFANYLRKQRLNYYCNLMNNHNVMMNGLKTYFYYYDKINYWNNTSNYINDDSVISEYDIFEGQHIFTESGY